MNINWNRQSNGFGSHCVLSNYLKASGRFAYGRVGTPTFVMFLALSFLILPKDAIAKCDEPNVTNQDMKGWIEDLGSDEYSKRQLATLQLNKRKEDAIPFVLQAVQSASGERADRLFQFLSLIAADPYSDSGKLAFDSLTELAASRTTSKSIRSEKILQVIGAEQRDLAVTFLTACKATLVDRELQVMSGRMRVQQPLVIDETFTGNGVDLDCLKWLTNVQFARLQGIQINREILQQVAGLPHLKKLQLIETQLTVDDLEVLRNAPDLDLLEFVYSPLGDESLELLVSLPVWGDFYLFGTKLTQSGQQMLRSRLDGVDLFISRGGFLGVIAFGNSTVINDVVRGGAADRANLRRGDKMLSVNNVTIGLFEDLRKQLAKFADGEVVTLEVERTNYVPSDEFPERFVPKKERAKVQVTLGKRIDATRDR